MRRDEFSTAARWSTGLAVLAAAVFAIMWIGWLRAWSWVQVGDASTLDAAYRIGTRHHGWVTFWDAWCTVFSPLTFRVLTLGLIGYALIRRRTRPALFLFVSVELSGLVTEGVKGLADRPRPATAMVHAASTSFPSGHALGSMVAVLALGVVLLPCLRPALRPAVITAGALIVLTVGIGRVALNVHHLSDVVAGWALGYLYFALCVLVVPLTAPPIPPFTAAAETPEAPGTAR